MCNNNKNQRVNCFEEKGMDICGGNIDRSKHINPHISYDGCIVDISY
jgi:hypothetical protein